MSKEFKNYLSQRIIDFNIIKKNKKNHKFKVNEGYFTFEIDLKKTSCLKCNNNNGCSLKKCYHIYKIYNSIYNIPFEKLQFLWINDNYLKVLDNKEIEIQPPDIECPICLEDAGSNDYNPNKVIHCLDCGKFYHINCLNKTKKGIVCLNCTNNWLPDWMK